jgi:membrane-associated phospholipid phosphatase
MWDHVVRMQPPTIRAAIVLVVGVPLAYTQTLLPPEPPAAATPAQPAEDTRDRVLYSDETESIKPLTRKLIRNIIYDQKEIWTSPFHMHRKDAGWWILFGGATGALIATDHITSRQLPNTADQIAISRDFSQAGAEYTILPVIGGLYIFGAIKDNPKARETSMLGAEAALDSVIVFEVLKAITQRPRPLEKDGGGHFFKGGDAFPSGHSVSIWAVASVVAHEYNKNKLVPIAAYSLATLVSASRFSARKHFASDVVVGGAMGWFIGRYVFQNHYDHAIHKRNAFTHALSHPRINPDLQPGANRYGLSLHWNY